MNFAQQIGRGELVEQRSHFSSHSVTILEHCEQVLSKAVGVIDPHRVISRSFQTKRERAQLARDGGHVLARISNGGNKGADLNCQLRYSCEQAGTTCSDTEWLHRRACSAGMTY